MGSRGAWRAGQGPGQGDRPQPRALRGPGRNPHHLAVFPVSPERASMVTRMAKNAPAVQKTQVRSLGQEDRNSLQNSCELLENSLENS